MEEKDLIEKMKLIFVTRQECQDTTDSLEGKLGKDSVRLAVIETELKQIKWLIGLVLAGVVANLVNSILSII